MVKNRGKKLLSDLKFYNDYSKWNYELERYENWDEACESVFETHNVKYAEFLPELKPYMDRALQLYQDKTILASQRNLQYRGEQIHNKNERIYNCATTYMDGIEKIHQAFFLSLCGCGVGVSLLKHWTSKLPNIVQRNEKKVKRFVIPDSIEGWADAAGVLMSSFCDGKVPFKEYQGCIIHFDYSLIREKGSMISGGFKAPGPSGLKQSLERIESLLNCECIEGSQMRPIIAYDCMMHLADATLSGGVRRAAFSVIIDETDEEMLKAKTGNWRETNKQRERSNNSIGLMRNKFSKARLKELMDLNTGMSDLGFCFLTSIYEILNPCFEIDMAPIWDLKKETTGIEFCNLTEINAKACITRNKLDRQKFYDACEAASIIGTLQAGYTDFPYLGKVTEDIVKREALIGVSITAWMDNPELFSEEVLAKGAQIVKETNSKIAKIIGINEAARCTTTKPSGNASVILGVASGIHAEHALRYFRIMQVNKESEIGKWIAEECNPDMYENSVWNALDTDYVIYVPIQNDEISLFKDDIKGIAHLEKIKFAQEHWVNNGKREDLCTVPELSNNISCTVLIDDPETITDYLFENQNAFTAVSFLSDTGDKDYPQSPFTSVLNSQELLDKYGNGVMFASGLIVDGLQYFNGNLWEACDLIKDRNRKLSGTRQDVLLQTDWIRRAKQFARNNHKNDLDEMIYCLKDVHLWHKWCKVTRGLKEVNFEEILLAPKFNDVSSYTAQACSGNSCEIKQL
jgi:ribonucleoside-diphosphate reductase alpha chain